MTRSVQVIPEFDDDGCQTVQHTEIGRNFVGRKGTSMVSLLEIYFVEIEGFEDLPVSDCSEQGLVGRVLRRRTSSIDECDRGTR